MGFDQTFAFMRSVGDGFLSAYVPILSVEKMCLGARLSDSGNCIEGYVEFNRSTTEVPFWFANQWPHGVILMSLPPLVRWEYGYSPDDGSPEATLMTDFLRPRDWLGLETAAALGNQHAAYFNAPTEANGRLRNDR